MTLMQQLSDGMLMGSCYGLLSMGYTLLYGLMGFVNFSHGELLMVGAYTGWTICQVTGLSIYVALPAGCLAGMLASFLCWLVCVRFDEGQSSSSRMIKSLGCSFLLQFFIHSLFGGDVKGYPPQSKEGFSLSWEVSPARIRMVVVAVVLLICLLALFRWSKRFWAIRAMGENQKGATICGIGQEEVSLQVFLISGALAGIAGVLWGSCFSLSPSMGSGLGLKTFTASALGQMGSVGGGFFGGIALGLVETLVASSWSGGLKNAVTFVVLICCLLLSRPKEEGVSR